MLLTFKIFLYFENVNKFPCTKLQHTKEETHFPYVKESSFKKIYKRINAGLPAPALVGRGAVNKGACGHRHIVQGSVY